MTAPQIPLTPWQALAQLRALSDDALCEPAVLGELVIDELLVLDQIAAKVAAATSELYSFAARIAAAQTRHEHHPDHGEWLRGQVNAEIGAALRVHDRTVARRIDEAEIVHREYGDIATALEAGAISQAHVTCIVNEGVVIDDPESRARYATAVLPHAETLAVNELRPVAKRFAVRFAGKTIEQRHAEARRSRCVRVEDLPDEMTKLTAVLPMLEGHAIFDRLTRQAREVQARERRAAAQAEQRLQTAGEPVRPMGTEPRHPWVRRLSEIRADLIADTILNWSPEEHLMGYTETDERCSLPQNDGVPECDRTSEHPSGDRSVTGGFGGRDTSHETLGRLSQHNTRALSEIHAQVQVIIPVMTLLPAEQQQKLRALGVFDLISGLAEGPGAASLAGKGPMSDDTAKLIAGKAAGWDRVLTHPITGSVLTVDRYQPSRELRRTLAARDLHCRFPGCRQPAMLSEVDHTRDWQYGGTTTLTNLAHLCTFHHMLKHHTDWGVEQLQGGVLEWRSPLGRKYLDRPPSAVMFQPIDTGETQGMPPGSEASGSDAPGADSQGHEEPPF